MFLSCCGHSRWAVSSTVSPIREPSVNVRRHRDDRPGYFWLAAVRRSGGLGFAPYPGSVHSTAALLAAAFLGLVVGVVAVIAFWWSQTADQRDEEAHTPDPPVVPEAASEVLAVLKTAYVVLDTTGDVLRSSPLAYSFGIVRATGGDYPRLSNSDLVTLASKVGHDGAYREATVRVPRGGSARTSTLDPGDPSGDAVLAVRLGALGSDKVLLLAEDLTRAVRVEETRRDFVANVSHELKTPVGALTLLAETMEDAADDPDAVRRFADRMQAESTRLGALVQEIIELSRVQGASALADAVAVDVDDVVDAAVATHRNLAEASGLEIVTGHPSGRQVYGSQSMLVTALGNLISNAIAYSAARTHIGVGTRTADGMVEISVTDEGRGISQDNLKRVFERFFRVDRARSRTTGGTGLGLAVVKHIARDHGGDVTAWSVEGKGSTFTLRVPEMGHAHGVSPPHRPLASSPQQPPPRKESP